MGRKLISVDFFWAWVWATVGLALRGCRSQNGICSVYKIDLSPQRELECSEVFYCQFPLV